MNKRDLKAFSRFDGTGRIVPGSTVLRRQKPKVGNWKEIPAYECCNYVATTFIVGVPQISRFPGDYFSITIDVSQSCASEVRYNISQYELTYTNLDELVIILNAELPQFGVFSNVDDVLCLTMPNSLIDAICPGSVPTMLYYTGID